MTHYHTHFLVVRTGLSHPLYRVCSIVSEIIMDIASSLLITKRSSYYRQIGGTRRSTQRSRKSKRVGAWQNVSRRHRHHALSWCPGLSDMDAHTRLPDRATVSARACTHARFVAVYQVSPAVIVLVRVLSLRVTRIQCQALQLSFREPQPRALPL